MKYIRYKHGSGYKKHASAILAYLNVQIAILSMALPIGISAYAIMAASGAAIIAIALARNSMPESMRLYLILLLPNSLSLMALFSIIR